MPRLIKFSGILKDLAGKPLTGPVDVTFALYAQQAGGTPLWFETQTVQADSLGQYTVLLGAMHTAGVPIESFASGEAHWLGVQVGNLPEQPRVLLLSVPYALKAGDAETLGGKPASAYILAPESESKSSSETNTSSTTTSGSSSSPSSTTVATGIAPLIAVSSQNYIPVFTANDGSMGNSVIYQSSGKIGVGTTAPGQQLDIVSNGGMNGTTIAVGDFVDAGSSYGYAQGSFQLRNPAFGGGAGQEVFSFGAEGYLTNSGVVTNNPAQPYDFYVYDTAGGGIYKAIFEGGASGRIGLGGNITYPPATGISGAALLIDSAGHVGIGTATPTHALEVNGTAQFDSDVSFAQPISTSGVLTS
ncbi:MAG TPA: hypothetical protein VE197_00835, partial [Mycobacterium sp.]|nr:hypothetical protein [Mycobacterium sp.]